MQNAQNTATISGSVPSAVYGTPASNVMVISTSVGILYVPQTYFVQTEIDVYKKASFLEPGDTLLVYIASVNNRLGQLVTNRSVTIRIDSAESAASALTFAYPYDVVALNPSLPQNADIVARSTSCLCLLSADGCADSRQLPVVLVYSETP